MGIVLLCKYFVTCFFVFVSGAKKLEIDSDVSSRVVVFEMDGSLADEDELLLEL